MKKQPAKKNLESVLVESNRLGIDVPEEFRDAEPNRINDEGDRDGTQSKVRDRLNRPSPAPGIEITPELIRQRAYALYEQRIFAGTSLDHVADWIEAERQLRAGTNSA